MICTTGSPVRFAWKTICLSESSMSRLFRKIGCKSNVSKVLPPAAMRHLARTSRSDRINTEFGPVKSASQPIQLCP